eukprot:CAMPEP_0181179926 /NCGR_PEP_ID=MMETSP1096-20121128/6524_1 /TAXON_ID=156174 ORGANISM="Chrysochromulina ericina, Strain CCMP281" /NCGR_SAMPLE_ID=MMETSP1096 /ASSEMBLY_ACC=CAM_ASM_000453 /LENGTH=290 /DNA_ID=CAMNT_0023268315 /DNA_START=1330 /DNA_END=2204 /DNA_ORIENTATION=-
MRGFVQRTLALKPVYLRRRSGLPKPRSPFAVELPNSVVGSPQVHGVVGMPCAIIGVAAADNFRVRASGAKPAPNERWSLLDNFECAPNGARRIGETPRGASKRGVQGGDGSTVLEQMGCASKVSGRCANTDCTGCDRGERRISSTCSVLSTASVGAPRDRGDGLRGGTLGEAVALYPRSRQEDKRVSLDTGRDADGGCNFHAELTESGLGLATMAGGERGVAATPSVSSPWSSLWLAMVVHSPRAGQEVLSVRSAETPESHQGDYDHNLPGQVSAGSIDFFEAGKVTNLG